MVDVGTDGGSGVVDADGQVLHAQAGVDLLRKGKPDRSRIGAFLEQWAPPR